MDISELEAAAARLLRGENVESSRLIASAFLASKEFDTRNLIKQGDVLFGENDLDDIRKVMASMTDWSLARQTPSPSEIAIELGISTEADASTFLAPIERQPLPLTRKALLLGSHAAHKALTYALPLGTVWNKTRTAGGPGGPRRQAFEFLAGVLMAGTSPDLDKFAADLEKSLEIYPEFQGDVGRVKESIKGIATSLAGGAGVTPAVLITALGQSHANDWLILGFIIAFLFIALSEDVAQLVVGKQMVAKTSDGAFTDAFKSASKKAVSNYLSYETFIRTRIPFFVAHYGYHFYVVPMRALARNKHEDGALLFTAVFFFFMSYKITAEVMKLVPV